MYITNKITHIDTNIIHIHQRSMHDILYSSFGAFIQKYSILNFFVADFDVESVEVHVMALLVDA